MKKMKEKQWKYFAQVPRINIQRNVDHVLDMRYWERLRAPLMDMKIDRINGILEHLEPALCVDFANKYIGGGVLGDGNVQEELYFATHPELYLSILCCAEMQDNEAIVVVGAERVATYTGYGYTASFDKVVIESRQTDAKGRLEHYMVAMDACPYHSDTNLQFRDTDILRELNKALIGFRGDLHERQQRTNTSELMPIVTGNWGCGSFCGDPQLKSLIQWIAATTAKRRVVYCVHNDSRMTREFEAVVEKYKRQPANVLLADIFTVVRTQKAQLSYSTTLFAQLLRQHGPDRDRIEDDKLCDPELQGENSSNKT